MLYMVSKEKHEALKRKLEQLKIKKSDVIEKYIRSSGRGGQKVNKTATCVYLKHIPTSIEIKCSESGSQSLNRFLAWRRLAERIEARFLGRSSPQQKRNQKIRKQKQKRHKRAKNKADTI